MYNKKQFSIRPTEIDEVNGIWLHTKCLTTKTNHCWNDDFDFGIEIMHFQLENQHYCKRKMERFEMICVMCWDMSR